MIVVAKRCIKCGHGFTGIHPNSIPNERGVCGWCEPITVRKAPSNQETRRTRNEIKRRNRKSRSMGYL